MYRYIALIWNEQDPQSNATAAFIKTRLTQTGGHWSAAFESEGMTVYHTGESKGRMQASRLTTSGGVVVGKLFTTHGKTVGDTIEDRTSHAIVASSGQHLIDDFWGRYVAFIHDTKRGTKSVVKSPIEGFRCYFTEYKSVSIYFSFPDDITKLDFLSFSINWHHIANHLAYFNMDKHDTAFHEMGKLQSGDCRQHEGRDIRSLSLWNPTQLLHDELIEDTHEAAQLIREKALSCVSAWASCHSTILHKLSGGLDSTIVLACLRQCKEAKDIVCVNYHPSSDKSGDERYFARIAAGHFGVELIEREQDAKSLKMENLFEIAPLAGPEWYLTALDRCGFEADLSEKLGATGAFGGEGGDPLFFQYNTHYITSDYLERHGLNRRLFHVAMDTARLSKKSIWSILGSALKDQFIQREGDEFIDWSIQARELLNPAYMEKINFVSSMPPLLQKAHSDKSLPKGKLMHLMVLSFVNQYHHTQRFADFLELCYPLLSQPLIELYVKIPTYLLTHSGKDRGLTRLAFKDDLPAQILRRHSKGGIEIYAQEIYDTNHSFIKDLLLNGILVQQKMLNKEALERALSDTDTIESDVDAGTLLRHACTEIWLRKAMQASYKVAA
ncbi:asparagine synthase C-terminal domain-containing protein [Eilatimonas milleporae]|uniref:asparagine synthase (glutamine-hydrolyzing) n=1 Tax=Eilatimonas milleporae TaxID=911205 RepID=A0A3M0C565_9PROT|nr:asparagine synthase C-terminal domain-containing protein [Eilatimonas milleporae]RMB04991.1 asparagine synthase (glutamine-hydrolysing) [Eilatimonas milleporae]